MDKETLESQLRLLKHLEELGKIVGNLITSVEELKERVRKIEERPQTLV